MIPRQVISYDPVSFGPLTGSDAPTVKFCCCHRTLLSSIEKRKGLYPPIQFILTVAFLQILTSPFLPARFHLFSHQLKLFAPLGLPGPGALVPATPLPPPLGGPAYVASNKQLTVKKIDKTTLKLIWTLCHKCHHLNLHKQPQVCLLHSGATIMAELPQCKDSRILPSESKPTCKTHKIVVI